MNINSTPPKKQLGFALISTIAIMSLLLLVSLAMLSSSTSETRTSRVVSYDQQAQANAKLALMIAIGELQKSAGPDQRITANANIFDQTPNDEAITGVEHPHYLAVMDSWDTFLNEKKYLRNEDGTPSSHTISIQDTYSGTKGRHKELFRRYLVSHPNDALLKDVNAALSPDVLGLNQTNSVLLATKPNADANDKSGSVRVGLVELRNSAGDATGKYAWHVEGLNSKVPYHKPKHTPSDGSLANNINDSIVPRGFDLSSVSGLEDVDPDLTDDKLISTSQLQILADRESVSAKQMILNGYPQISLLSDVRFSGLKKDINSLFETNWNNVESKYKSAKLAGVNIQAPLRSVNGLDKLNQVEKNVPPTSWRQLRDFYMLYQQNTGHSNHLGVSQAHLMWDSSGAPMSDTFVSGEARQLAAWHHDFDNPGSIGIQRTPVIARWIYIVSLSSRYAGQQSGVGQYDLYVHYNPVVVLWNPYNTKLRLANRGVQSISGNRTQDSDFMIQTSFSRAFLPQFKVYRNNSSLLRNWTNFSNSDGAGQWADVMFKEANGSDVVLKPGEVKMFSYDSSSAQAGSGHLALTPGFNANVKDDYRQKAHVGRVSANDQPSLAMRFTPGTGHVFGAAPSTSTVYGGSISAFAIDTTGQVYDENYGKARKTTRGHRGGKIIDWMSQPGIQIIPDSTGQRARWQSLGNSKPVAEAVVGVFLKSSVDLPEDNYSPSSKDVRNRNWLHSNPAHWWNHLFFPDQQKRTNYGYELHYNGKISGNAISSYVQSTSDHNAFIGRSMEADGASFFPYQELPVTPITNLASLSGLKLSNGKTLNIPQPFAMNTWGSWGRNIQYASWGPAFGVGIGNSVAHPMINGNGIYTGYANHRNYTGQSIFGNYWDNLFMANDALWDSWFCSSLSAQQRPAFSTPQSRDELVSEFVKGNKHLPNYNLTLSRSGKSEEELIEALQASDAYNTASSHLLVENGFNVNTASVEAWKALLHGLKGNQVPFIDAVTGDKGIIPNTDDLIISRFGYATGKLEGTSDDDPEAWKGIRRLNDGQIDRLAKEMVKQVKLRGPFLNMSEFINRRLSDDKLGITGPMQAAIDWDDFDSDYSGNTGTSDASSINAGFKNDSITQPNASFTNPKAANGSRHTGIPGYVMQADVLKLLGNSLTVRDDCFVIRAYGEALDEKGQVAARAWCEAVVQRTPEYVQHDSGDNAPHQPAYTLDETNRTVPSTTLSKANLTFGRKLKIISFRWTTNPDLN